MFGISWLAYALLALGLGAVAVALFAPHREAPDVAQDAPAETPEPDEPAAERPWPAWPSLVDGREADLPAGARLSLIEGLGALGEPWCGPVLVAAYREEEEAAAREAVLAALRDVRYRACEEVVADALRSSNGNERVLAVELADAVDLPALLDAALGDAEPAVALAAVYALKKRLNGSLIAHLEQHVARERCAELLDAVGVLT